MTLQQRYNTTLSQIGSACQKAHRAPNSVHLIAVSKTQPIAAIRELAGLGQKTFGENYAQELVQKAEALAELKLEWHFIGHLQKNKINMLLPHVQMIHSIDSISIAEAVAKRCTRYLPALIEVNVGGEASKTGIPPDKLQDLLHACNSFDHLDIQGFMCIPPPAEEAATQRRFFATLSDLLVQTNREQWYRTPLTELSMGMSHDFPVAIACGATYIRVGTALFGERKTP